jgi:hypothetical protein
MVISDGIPAVPRNRKHSGIPFRTLPRKRKQLGIPFRGIKIEANSRNFVPNLSAEEKITRNNSDKFCRKDQRSYDAQGHYILRMPHSSFRVRRRSVGCSVAQKDAAQLRRGQRSSKGGILA